VQYFSKAEEETIEEVTYTMREDTFEDGEFVVKAGDPCDSIIFVTEGQV